jgi:hypothetical protein
LNELKLDEMSQRLRFPVGGTRLFGTIAASRLFAFPSAKKAFTV